MLESKVAYLRGLLDGQEIDPKYRKLFAAVADALDAACEELSQLHQTEEELLESLNEVSDDLAEVEDIFFDDEEDDDDDKEDDEEDDDEDDEDEDEMLEFICPQCQARVLYDIDSFDAEDEHLCPKCGAALFDEED